MESKLKKSYKQWLFLVPLCLFVLDFILISTKIITPIDQFVFNLLRQFENDSLTNLVIMITHLGSFIGIVVAIIFVLIFNRRIGMICLELSLIQHFLNRLIKAIVQRPRPSVVHLVKETSSSFPSGHAMAITCLYSLFVYYLYHSNLRYKKLLIVICSIIIVLVCLSRVYLGVHYFSDVLGGALLSLSLVMYISNMPFFQA